MDKFEKQDMVYFPLLHQKKVGYYIKENLGMSNGRIEI